MGYPYLGGRICKQLAVPSQRICVDAQTMHRMFRSLLLGFSLLVAVQASAQLPEYAAAPNFSGTSLDGQQIDLYSWLDSGKVVIVDVMAVWCPPCWSYHQTHILRDVYEQYGPNGTDEVRVVMIEADPSTPESTLRGGGRSIGDWTAGTPYPILNIDQVNDDYNIRAFPTFYAISANRTVHEIQRAGTAEQFVSYALTLPGKSDFNRDGIVHTARRLSAGCDGQERVEVVVQNIGAEPVSGAEVRLTANGEIAVLADNLDLAPFEVRFLEEQVPDAILYGAAADVAIELDLGVADEAPQDNLFNFNYGSGATALTEVTVEFTTDFFPADARWAVFYNGTAIASKVFTGAPGSADANRTHTRSVTLPSGDGCYTVFWLDQSSNGASVYDPASDPVPGIRIIDAEGRVVLNYNVVDHPELATNFGDQREFTFRTSPLASGLLEQAPVHQLALSPNPIRSGGLLSIDLPGLGGEQYEVRLIDAVGRSTGLGLYTPSQLRALSIPQLPAGVYSLQVVGDEATAVGQVQVN